MEEPQQLPEITTEFMSSIVGQKVKSFIIKPGSNVGDNYMSVLYSFEVELEEPNGKGEKNISLLSKCFPSHPTRQQFLKMSNVFYNELKVYNTLIPALSEMAINNGIKEKLPFSPLVGGTAVDFAEAKKNDDKPCLDKIYGQFDNFITMPDLRAEHFSMADRKVGLDLEHTKLVMKAYAKLHSLSWAYKLIHDLEAMGKKFPFIEFNMEESDMDMFTNVLGASVQNALDVLEPNTEIYKRTQVFKEIIGDMMKTAFDKSPGAYANMANFHRVKPDISNWIDWKVVTHGDCWLNNMLFRYNEQKVPEEVVLIDLQMLKEACPTSDLVYLLYSSTNTEFRKKHLTDMLQLYFDEFLKHCKILGVEPLPNFTFAELQRRFHIAKIFGYCMAITVLPIMLKNADEMQDMEKMKQDSNMEEMFSAVMNDKISSNKKFQERIVNTAQELYDEGVL